MATAKKTTKKTTAKSAAGKKTEMKMVCGYDAGNGFFKGKSTVDDGKPERVDLPSCVSYVPVGYKWLPADPTDEYMENLVNRLDCEIKSPILPEADKRRILVGERAATTSNSLIQFSINDRSIPKCDEPLSTQLILATIAAQALKAYWDKNGELPEASLQVAVDLGVALPFTDYVKYKDRYSSQLEDNKHVVQILNFETPITVNISIDTTSVLAEGQAALYAISDLGSDFVDAVIQLAKDEDGVELDDEIDGESLIEAENVVAIDIGEGTTGFAVAIQGVIEPSSSSSINKGVGTLLEEVVDSTRSTRYEIGSRKELDRLLRNESPTPAQRAVKEHLAMLIREQADILARDIIAEYSRVIAPIKFDIEAVYVIGGGADIMKEALYERLLDASEVAPGVTLPVLFMASSYSRDMNRTGLYQIAEMAHEAKK